MYMISPGRNRRIVYESGMRQKRFFTLNCTYCESLLTTRSTSSALLSDPAKTLYSADIVINVEKINDAKYKKSTCGCHLYDTACLCCGNIVGYYVKRPCDGCISGHNGHFYVFLKEKVNAKEFYQNFKKMMRSLSNDVYR